MSHQPKHIYEFGPFCLDAAEHLLLRDGEAVPLTPKAFDLLLALVERHGHLLEKEELLKKVWPDTFVEETNLSYNISHIRKALGDGENGQKFIETVPKRGYRFVASVREVVEEGEESMTRVQASLVNQRPEPLIVEPAAASAVERYSFLTSWRALVVASGLLLAAVAGSVHWRGSERPAAISSLAVLPMKPLVARNHDEAFEMGMADTLIFRLSGLKQLIVRPVSAVRKYTNPEQDPLAVGREQQVNFVLDPSFQRDGERIRVRARLLNVATGETVWTYECEEQYCSNLFVMQDAISAKVVNALSLQLTGADRVRMNRHGTENREAYLLCLRGRYHVDKRSPEEAEKGIEYFQQAIKLDPNYALAHAGLAEAYHVVGLRRRPHEMMPRAKAAVEKALELDAQLGEAYSLLATIKGTYDWNRQDAEQAHQRAVELSPNVERTHRYYALSLMFRGRFDEALIQINRALEIEPLSVVVNRDKAQILCLSRQYDRAIEQCQKTLDLDPNFSFALSWLGRSFELKGDYDQAVAAYLKRDAVLGSNPEEVAALRTAYTVSGWKGYWQTQLALLQKQMKQEAQRNIYSDPYPLVQIYARLGEKERAFEWLEKSYAERRSLIYVKVDPLLDGLRSNPRFTDLLRRIGFEP